MTYRLRTLNLDETAHRMVTDRGPIRRTVTPKSPRSSGPSLEVLALAAQRFDARLVKDYSLADSIRTRIESLGWIVEDYPGGYRVVPMALFTAPTNHTQPGTSAASPEDPAPLDCDQ